MKQLYFLLLFLSLTMARGQQWKQIDGPYGYVPVYDIVENNTHTFVATRCGVFSRPHSSGRWNKISNFYSEHLLLTGDSLLISGSITLGYINLIDETFDPFPSKIYNAPSLAMIGDTLFLGAVAGGGVSYYPKGDTLHSFNTGLPLNVYNDIVDVTGILLNGQYIYCSTKKGIYRSDLNLSSWVKKSVGISHDNMSSIIEIGDTLYSFNGMRDTIYQSSDEGESWQVFFADSVKLVTLLQYNNELWLATKSDEVLKSTDNGISWSAADSGLVGNDIGLLYSKGGKFYCSMTRGGLFYWNGNFWEAEDMDGMFCRSIISLESSTSCLMMTDGASVYRLGNSEEWIDISPDSTALQYIELHAKQDTMYLLMRYPGPNPYKIVYSINNGNTWNDLNNPFPPATYIYYYRPKLKILNNHLFVINFNEMFMIDLQGTHWTDVTPPIYCGDFKDLTYFDFKYLLIQCVNNILFELDPTTLTWTKRTNLFPSHIVSPDFFATLDTILFMFAGKEVWRRFETNSNWQIIDSNFRGVNHPRYEVVDSSLFILTTSAVVYTADLGQSWIDCGPSEKVGLYKFAVFNDELFVGTFFNGVFRRAMPVPVSSLPEKIKPSGIAVYPNPAHNYFTISTIEKPESRSWKILDQTGSYITGSEYSNDKRIPLPDLTPGLYILCVEHKDEVYFHKLMIE